MPRGADDTCMQVYVITNCIFFFRGAEQAAPSYDVSPGFGYVYTTFGRCSPAARTTSAHDS